MKQLAPSILSADFSRLGEEVGMIEKAGAHLIHVDVMDGHFVPNLTFGTPVISSLRALTELVFDVHLMVKNPMDFVDNLKKAGADFFTFHVETEPHADKLISAIHDAGMKAGITLVPSTPVSAISQILPLVDLVLVMSVNPGFSGQKFIPYSLDKIRELSKLRDEKNPKLLIQVDGGVGVDNIKALSDVGVDEFVAGSSVFKGDILKNIKALNDALGEV